MAENDEGKPGTENDDTPKDTENDLGDAGKRALDAERKARSAAERRAKDAEIKLKEAEDAEKSENERLKGQVTDLTSERDAAVSRADRFEIAAAKGLSLAQARRLVGSTREELEQDADEMRTELGLETTDDGKDEAPAPKARPKEALKMGASNEEDEQPDPGKVVDQILKSSW